MTFQLDAKRIIVTGGASGMGLASVQAYSREGAAVVLVDIDDKRGDVIAQEASVDAATPVTFMQCDVMDRTQVFDVFGEAIRSLGGLDVLANAAGVMREAPAAEVDDEHWTSILGINLMGTIYTNQAAFRGMQKTGGHIINFASPAGVLGSPGQGAYAASKGAVLAWTRTLAREWAPFGVRANAIAPSIWTPMYDGYRSRLSPEALVKEDMSRSARIPLGGKFGDANLDLAPVMVFLAGEGSRFITGQTFSVTGGALVLT